MRLRALTVAAVLGLALAGGVARGDAISAWESLFGADAREAAASRDGKKQAALAKKLLEAAPGAKDDAVLASLLYSKAYEFGMMSAEGYATAAAAAEGLAQDPKQAASANDKLLVVREKMYRAATGDARKTAAVEYVKQVMVVADLQVREGNLDEALASLQRAKLTADAQAPSLSAEVVGRIRGIQGRQATAKRLEQLREALRKESTDAKTATEFVELSLVEVDRPKECAAYAGLLEEGLKNVVGWAEKPSGELSEADALTLADWYRGRAAKASDVGKANAWRHVRELCERVLSTHTKKDEMSLRAEFGLKDAEKAMAALAATQQVAGGVIDLLAGVDVTQDAQYGPCTFNKATKVLSFTQGVAIWFNYQPPEEYDFRGVFTRKSGTGGFELRLSEGEIPFRVAVWGEAVAVEMSKKPEASARFAVETGKKIAVVVRVRKGGVAVAIDGRDLVNLRADYKDLRYPAPMATPLGINAVPGTMIDVEKVELVELGGKGKPLPRKKP